MLESVSRNPQAAAKLNAPFYVGMAFIESSDVAYLAAPEQAGLGVVKRRRKHRERTRLDTAALTANL